jgi:phosphoribosylglycinamide formyltransferase-1
VVAVGTDRDGVRALDRARAAGVEAFTVRPADHPDREAWDAALADALLRHEPDLVVCAGFMRILGRPVLDRFGGRVVNTHPALLPSFPGAHAVPDALAYGVKVTGVTVHLVDEGVDTGPVLAQAAVAGRAGRHGVEPARPHPGRGAAALRRHRRPARPRRLDRRGKDRTL